MTDDWTHVERTTEFVMSDVQAPPDTPVLFVKLSNGYLSLARLDDVQRLMRDMRDVLEALAGMTVEDQIFDQPLFALMSRPNERDEAWHVELLTKARALLATLDRDM